jgi:hypothetical protein
MALLVGGWFAIAPLTLFLSLSYSARISHTKAFGSLVRYSVRTYASESPYYLFSSMPGEVKGFQTALDHQDARPVLAQKLLAQYNSPLADQADFIVEKSDELGVDYRWPVAIAIAESGGCRYIPHESNNCWGYGVYGSQTVKFSDLREGITKVIELIADYQAKGAVTPEEVMRWYTPPSVEKGGPWAKTVRYLFRQME